MWKEYGDLVPAGIEHDSAQTTSPIGFGDVQSPLEMNFFDLNRQLSGDRNPGNKKKIIDVLGTCYLSYFMYNQQN